MNVQQYMEEMKNFHKNMIDYLDNEDSFQGYFDHLIKYLKDIFAQREYHKIKECLKLINKISNHHHRSPCFFDKIHKLLLPFIQQIKQTFSNSDIFKIFKRNKLIILFLIEKCVIEIDQTIINAFNDPKSNRFRMIEFFYRESKPFLSEDKIREIESQLEKYESDEFEENRKKGENESYLCELIRNDSIVEFITYVNRNNISFKSIIEPTIFETNPFLLKNFPSLIEYSAFYGSIQIFRYLTMNDANLSRQLWLYAIHGSNPEIIHYLEENHIEPPFGKYQECFKESIKCFSNEIANYIEDNLIDKQSKFNDSGFKYHNYFYFADDFQSNSSAFYYLCKYNYVFLVGEILNSNNVDIYEEIIQIQKDFL